MSDVKPDYIYRITATMPTGSAVLYCGISVIEARIAYLKSRPGTSGGRVTTFERFTAAPACYTDETTWPLAVGELYPTGVEDARWPEAGGFAYALEWYDEWWYSAQPSTITHVEKTGIEISGMVYP